MVVNLTQNPIITTKETLKKDDITEKKIDRSEKIETPSQQESDKVKRIKEMIKKGEYKIDIEATAKKIAEELL